jgi:hypothetical protein
MVKQFPHWVFVVRRDAEICPVPDPDWPAWYAPWLVCIVLDRESHQDIVPESGEFALWLMRDPCRPIMVSLATASSIVSGRPQELAKQIEREYTVQLATNSVDLSVNMNLDEVAPETFLFFDPGQQPTYLAVRLDWRVQRFADLPDFRAQVERLTEEEHPPNFRFSEAAKEWERDLWRRAEALKPGPGHYLPLEVRLGKGHCPWCDSLG